jgi:hypothetical protein
MHTRISLSTVSFSSGKCSIEHGSELSTSALPVREVQMIGSFISSSCALLEEQSPVPEAKKCFAAVEGTGEL